MVTLLYDDVFGQAFAVAALRAAALRPLHAYLLVGPPGTGKMAAATSFAASLLTSIDDEPPEEVADVRRRVRAGVHPDVITVERDGPAITIDTAREVTRLAVRSPVEGNRKVLILSDFHLVKEAGPALLKTIEDPPASTTFVILAEYVPPELVTIASRCARIDFAPLPPSLVVELLVTDGVAPELAAELAEASGGRLDRARLLAGDPGFEIRRQAWRAVPDQIDGSGAVAAAVAERLISLLEESVTPVRARQQAELTALEQRNARSLEVNGKVGRAGRTGVKAGVREMEERHRRELRRQRTDELRAGLATLAGVYGDRLAVGGRTTRLAIEAVRVIDQLGADLAYNPGESLVLLALLARLGRLGSTTVP